MKRFLAWTVVVVFVVGGAVLTFWPVSFWRLYDADWNALALTSAENYCAGAEGMRNGFDRDDRKTKECTMNSDRDNETPSIAQSVKWGCEGVVSSGQFQGSVWDCQLIFEDNGLWLLEGGGFTYEWNDERPRPKPLDEGIITVPSRGSNRSQGVDPLINEEVSEQQTEENEGDDE
jgi:hypothetical protein